MTPTARATIAALTIGVLVIACCGLTAEGRAPTPYVALQASFAPIVVSAPTPEPSRRLQAVAGDLVAPAPRATTGTAGQATWYAAWYMNKGDKVGAAGPALRVGKWRGRIVTVCSGSKCVRVKLADWCACGRRGGVETLIDLSPAAFSALASTSQGVIRVTVEW